MAEMKRLWDNYKVVGEVRKSDSIKIVIGAGIRDGVKYINLREFYIRKRDNVWMPGRDGLTIPLTIPVESGAKVITPYTELISELIKASDTLETMPLYDEANAVYMPKRKSRGEKE